MKRQLARVVSLFFLLQVITPPVWAVENFELPAPDVEAPTIIFDTSNTEIEAGINTFSARVTDNVGVQKVFFYHRGKGDFRFKPKVMQRSASDPNVYEAELDLDPIISSELEIYIRAEDVTGNVKLKGREFEPMKFTVIPQIVEGQVLSVTEPVEPEKGGMSTLTMILIGIGAAALIGSSGGGGGVDDTGRIIIDTPLPQ